MSEYKISARAYSKIILHAAKYPHCAVNGILLAEKDSVKGKTIRIVDAIPLFHQCLYVTPMAEIALIQIEAMAQSEDLVIAGYYAGAENFYDSSIEKAPAGKIADKISENFPAACFIVIDNKMVGCNTNRPAINLWHNTDNRWSKSNFHLDHSENTLQTVSRLLREGAMKDIVDFDNHLDNPENDWTNQFLNRDLEQVMSMY